MQLLFLKTKGRYLTIQKLWLDLHHLAQATQLSEQKHRSDLQCECVSRKNMRKSGYFLIAIRLTWCVEINQIWFGCQVGFNDSSLLSSPPQNNQLFLRPLQNLTFPTHYNQSALSGSRFTWLVFHSNLSLWICMWIVSIVSKWITGNKSDLGTKTCGVNPA